MSEIDEAGGLWTVNWIGIVYGDDGRHMSQSEGGGSRGWQVHTQKHTLQMTYCESLKRYRNNESERL